MNDSNTKKNDKFQHDQQRDRRRPREDDQHPGDQHHQQRRQRHDDLRRSLDERFRRDRSNQTACQLWRSIIALQNNAHVTSWTSDLNPETADPDYVFLLSGALLGNTQLRRLELRQLVLSEADAHSLVRGINHSLVESVNIMLHSSPDKPLEAIWQILCKGLQSSRTIQEIQFQSAAGVKIAGLGELLSSLQSLRKLRLERFFVSDERGAQSLAKGVKESNLESLYVSQPNLLEGIAKQPASNHKAWQIIMRQGVKSLQTLCEFTFRSASMGQLIELGNILPWMKSLRKLSLEDTMLTEQSAVALANGIVCQSKLESLSFKQHYSELRSDLYGQVLSEVLPQATSLKRLELLNVPLDDDHTFITLLAKGMHENKSVASLVLGGWGVRESAVEILFERGLKQNSTLTQLSFHGCSFGNEIIMSLGEHWPLDSPIRSLCLHTCTINQCGTRALLGIVGLHPVLRKLELNGIMYCGSVGYEGLRWIGKWLVDQPHLTHINLTACAFWAKDDKTQEHARLLAGKALCDAIQSNRRIQHMQVEGNSFPAKMVKEIEFHAGLNRTGRYLLSLDHGLATSVWCHVLAKCGQEQSELSASLTYYHLREQPHLMRPPSIINN